jgi:hypothetical protein
VSFAEGGAQNADSAFLLFKGADIGKVFGGASEVSFTITPTRSFADRVTPFSEPGGWSAGFEVWDGSRPIITFNVLAREWKPGERHLQFYHGVGGISTVYTVPSGDEETIFGAGVVTRFRLAWDEKTYSLFINDNLVDRSGYVGSQPSFGATSFLVIGARAAGGALSKIGYFASPDSISEFEAQ